MARVVCDTNILVSSAIAPAGNSAKIVNACRQGKIHNIVSLEIIKELKIVLSRSHIARKYHLSQLEINRVVRSIKFNSIIVRPANVSRIAKLADDNDTIVVAAAVAGDARWIITGDPHLTKLKRYKKITILTPAEFVKIMKL